MRPHRTSSKNVDYAAIERTPESIRTISRMALSERSPADDNVPKKQGKDKKRKPSYEEEETKDTKRNRVSSPIRTNKPANKDTKLAVRKSKNDKESEDEEPVSPIKINKRDKKEKKDKKADKENTEVPSRIKRLIKRIDDDDEEEQDMETIEIEEEKKVPAKKASPKKTSPPVQQKPLPQASSSQQPSKPAASQPPKPAASQPSKPAARQYEDPIVAFGNIVGDEIKAGSSKICALESDMVMVRASKELSKVQDSRYENLRDKFEELKAVKKKVAQFDPEVEQECRGLLAQLKEDAKQMEEDQTVVKKKLKQERKDLEKQWREVDEERKEVEKERRRVDEEGREIEIEKRRMERKELEKERADLDRQRWLIQEEKKEVGQQTHRNSDHSKELDSQRRRLDEERHAHAKEHKRLEDWAKELEREKRKLEETRRHWDADRRKREAEYGDEVARLKWQIEKEKQESDRNKLDNEQLAGELNTATSRWASEQDKMKNEIQKMVLHINRSEKDADTVLFYQMITGLKVAKLEANRYQCECTSANKKTHVKFEMTIRDTDVEYTPVEVYSQGHLPECVKEEVFFPRESFPIFLCKVLSSVFRQ